MAHVTKRNTRHEQVTVKVPDTKELIQVDKKMAALLITMWSIGITTKHSCQGDGHLFVDQTCFEANRYRAYVLMERNRWSVAFVQALITNYPAFKSEKCSWDIAFDRNPYTEEERITIYFPSDEIGELTSAIESWN